MSQNLATNLCVGGNEATPRHPFALNLSIKDEIKLTWDAKYINLESSKNHKLISFCGDIFCRKTIRNILRKVFKHFNAKSSCVVVDIFNANLGDLSLLMKTSNQNKTYNKAIWKSANVL